MINSKASMFREIDEQVQKKLAMKRGIKKRIKAFLERFGRWTCYRIPSSSRVHVKHYNGSSSLGADEFGRDIADGVSKYLELLRRRGLKINTFIVLGSRAKGSWKPTSDVDVTIIGDNLPAGEKNSTIKRLLSIEGSWLRCPRSLCLGIEPSGCCSKQEFLRRIEQFDIQALDALCYGVVVYDDGFWHEAKRKLRQLETDYGFAEAELKKKLLRV